MARIVLREIAERVGCSRSTVSYALKNRPNIPAATRQKILKVARELGWQPDADLAQQMSLVRRTASRENEQNMAVVIHKSSEDLRVEMAPFLHVKGACTYARELGYHVDFFNLIDQPLSPKRLSGILKARGVSGLVFVATVHPEIPREYLAIGKDYACAVLGVRYPDFAYNVALSDFLAAGRLAILNILAVGFSRPGVIIPRGVDEPLGWGFTGGISAGMMDLAQSNRLPIVHTGQDEAHIPPGEVESVINWIKRYKPDCIVTTDALTMRQVISSMKGKDSKLPIFCLDWYPNQDVDGGINMRQEQVAQAAVDSVVAQMHRGEKGLPKVQRAILVEGKWVWGEGFRRRSNKELETVA